MKLELTPLARAEWKKLPWLVRTTFETIWNKGRLPYWIQALWHLRLMKIKIGDNLYIPNEDARYEDMKLKFFGEMPPTVRDDVDRFRGFSIRIPW